jgi:hypothetical protein
MIRYFIAMSLVILTSTSVNAGNLGAGVGSSGGGNAVVCRDEKNQILSAQFYDLYEGEVRKGFAYPSTAETRDALLMAMDSYSRFEIKEYTKAEINAIVAGIVTLPSKVALEPSQDFGRDRAIVVPVGCHLEGVGYYETDGQLMVSGDVYEALVPLHRAAFLLHEAIYKRARHAGATNSEDVRSVVALIMSGNMDKLEQDGALKGFLYGQEPDYVAFLTAQGVSRNLLVTISPNEVTTPYKIRVRCIPYQGDVIQKVFTNLKGKQQIDFGDVECQRVTGQVVREIAEDGVYRAVKGVFGIAYGELNLYQEGSMFELTAVNPVELATP